MRYPVLKDFADEVHKVAKTAGETFIPAETNFPYDKVQALVASGTLGPRIADTPAPPDATAGKSKK